MATPRLVTRGVEALWTATEQEALAIFRFFAALIFVDPRLADMLPLDLGTQGTALSGGWQNLQSLVALTAADRGRPALRAVRGHLFRSDRAPRLDVDECRKLQCLTDIMQDADAGAWPEWHDFWRGQLRPPSPRAPSAVPSASAAIRAWTSAPPPGKVLILTPLKDIAEEADAYCRRLSRLNYPAHRLSLGLLESDSSDGTYAAFDRALNLLRPRWHRVDIWKHDYAYRIPHGLGRWHPTVQLTRRKVLAQSRNELLRRALQDEDWALWLDADVIDYPSDIIEQLLCYGRDILQPHCVLDYGGPTLDRNAWRDHGRVHMESLRGRELLAPLDAVGGTLLFIRADLHRRGLLFPETPYGEGNPRIRSSGQCYDLDHPGELETEGLGIMASDMGVQCWGLPELEILHRRR